MKLKRAGNRHRTYTANDGTYIVKPNPVFPDTWNIYDYARVYPIAEYIRTLRECSEWIGLHNGSAPIGKA